MSRRPQPRDEKTIFDQQVEIAKHAQAQQAQQVPAELAAARELDSLSRLERAAAATMVAPDAWRPISFLNVRRPPLQPLPLPLPLQSPTRVCARAGGAF